MKKRKPDNPNSWVFERGIGITMGDVYNLNGNKRRKIVRVVFSLLFLVGYFLLSIFLAVQRRGQIPVPAVGQQDYDGLFPVLRTLRLLHRRPEGRPGGYAH